MLALFSEDSRSTSQLQTAIPSDMEVTPISDLDLLEGVIPDTDCSLVYIRWLPASTNLCQLAAIKEAHPRYPTVLVTRWDMQNARHLKDVSVEEVIWFREIERELPTALRRACAHQPNVVHCLGVAFEEAGHLPDTLRNALALACRSNRPVLSVQQLAHLVHCDRRTLWRQWSRAVGDSSAVRLQDFLHWLLLHRAVGLKVPGCSWEQVAEDVGIHEDTLSRWAKRLAGRPLRMLAKDGPEAVSTLLYDRMVPLLSEKGEGLDIL